MKKSNIILVHPSNQNNKPHARVSPEAVKQSLQDLEQQQHEIK